MDESTLVSDNVDPKEAAVDERLERLRRAEKTGVLPLRFWPDEALKTAAEPVNVEELGDQLKSIIEAMFSTMYMTGGVGLAGPQVGYMKRVFVMDSSPNGKNPIALINPVIDVASPHKADMKEGCLSFPGIKQSIKRSSQIVLTYVDQSFTPQRSVLNGWAARIAQHEIEHLDGKTFLDSMTKNQRAYALRQLMKQRKEAEVLARESSGKHFKRLKKHTYRGSRRR